MKYFLPDSYYKNIYSINYDKLKSLNIKTILFDFDNTIIEKEKTKCTNKHKELFAKLKKDFKIVIISNTSNEKKIKSFADKCNIDYISFALKPLKRGFNKALKKYNLKKDQMCMVGDQLLTDILGAKRFNIKAVLVDCIDNNELKITKFNRLIEKNIIKVLYKKYKFKRGNYYD